MHPGDSAPICVPKLLGQREATSSLAIGLRTLVAARWSGGASSVVPPSATKCPEGSCEFLAAFV